MKVCKFRHSQFTGFGVLENSLVFPLPGIGSLVEALSASPSADGIPLAESELLYPLDTPRNLFCCAGNYYQHVVEGGGARPDKSTYSPRFFLKPHGVLTGPSGTLRIPRVSPARIDWECELAVVIGRPARHVSAGDAAQYIAGYTIFNDFSDRQFCLNPSRNANSWDPFFDWLHGKWHDGFGALGPVVVRDLDLGRTRLSLTVNGEPRQDSTLGDMIYSPNELVAALSQIVTLHPGDLIATGTPAGVADGGSGLWLKPGDVVDASIEGIGVLRTFVEAEQ